MSEMTLAEAVDQMCAEEVPAAWVNAIDDHLIQHAATVKHLADANRGAEINARINASLIGKLADARRDAARYRWLRSQHDSVGQSWHVREPCNDVAQELDQAIDAAMQSDSGGKMT